VEQLAMLSNKLDKMGYVIDFGRGDYDEGG
jgi:hypothetical protein